MHRLVKLTTLIACVAGMIIGTATFAGRAESTPANLATLRLTECALPCWIGIEIGHTSRIEARNRILAVFVKEHGYKVIGDSYSESLNLVRITLLSPEERAQRIDFTLATETSLAVQYIWIKTTGIVTVGELHALLGAPSLFLSSTPFPSLTYNSGDRGLRAYVSRVEILSPAEPVLYFELYANKQILESSQIWPGFSILSQVSHR
jgi:hypothetical protein